ncbi:hypothetical protein GOY17_07310 [Lysobacter soli]|uniref:PAAR domain-containing protein n=1 Tax=Lysobacter soli TaxID=453783 RepID=UPI0012EEC5D3|nr:PAAR domain-containing protein [Lysobacter soli]QGW64741.1 hypothetical protein GOY17_07310 [Lysobacter soli]
MSALHAIVVGDPTEVGGQALTGLADFTIQCIDGSRSALVCVGDSVLCGQCGMTTVVEGRSGFFISKPAAYHGCKLACGHRLVATRQRLVSFECIGSEKAFLPPSTASFASPLPGRFTEQYRAVDEKSGAFLAGIPYLIELSDGRTFTGRTNEEGLTVQVSSHVSEQVRLTWLNAWQDEADHDNQDIEGC